MLLEAKAESLRESGQTAGEQEGDEDEELRKAVEVSSLPSLPTVLRILISACMQRTNWRTKAQWVVPHDPEAFDLAELDDWEDHIVWGDSSKPMYAPVAFHILSYPLTRTPITASPPPSQIPCNIAILYSIKATGQKRSFGTAHTPGKQSTSPA